MRWAGLVERGQTGGLEPRSRKTSIALLIVNLTRSRAGLASCVETMFRACNTSTVARSLHRISTRSPIAQGPGTWSLRYRQRTRQATLWPHGTKQMVRDEGLQAHWFNPHPCRCRRLLAIGRRDITDETVAGGAATAALRDGHSKLSSQRALNGRLLARRPELLECPIVNTAMPARTGAILSY